MRLWKKRKKKVPKIPVTEFTITYFDLSALERQTLLNLYADHTYKFSSRLQVEAHVASTTYPSVERWEES